MNIALMQDFAISSPAKGAQRFVQSKIGSLACIKLDLELKVVHSIVVEVLHLSILAVDHLVVVAAVLHLGIVVAGLYLKLLGILGDDGRVVSIPNVVICAKLKLGGIVIEKFLGKDITIRNDSFFTSIPWSLFVRN